MQIDFEGINKKADIVKVVGNFVDITRKGKSYVAICPFHPDNNPSMNIVPEKGIYKCFSCGAGGGAVKFIKEYLKVPYDVAAKKVIEICGLDFNISVKTTKRPNDVLLDIYGKTILYYKYKLNNNTNKEIHKFLKKRNLSMRTINKFNLGWAGGENTSELVDFLTKSGFSKIDILASRLSKVSKKEDIIDYYWDRLVYPIYDEHNNPVGMTARTIANLEPKYLLLPESRVFKKGNTLYNSYNAIHSRRQEVYLVEGIHEVLRLYEKGIENSIALLGSNLTQKQIVILKKFKKVILLLDPDEAGKAAEEKIIGILSNENIEVHTIKAKLDSDPDTYFSNRTKEETREILEDTNQISVATPGRFKESNTWNSEEIIEPEIESKDKLIASLESEPLHAERRIISHMLYDPAYIEKFYFDSKTYFISNISKNVGVYLLLFNEAKKMKNDNYKEHIEKYKNGLSSIEIEFLKKAGEFVNDEECSSEIFNGLVKTLKIKNQKLIRKKARARDRNDSKSK